jgi:hypothetical protein
MINANHVELSGQSNVGTVNGLNTLLGWKRQKCMQNFGRKTT